LKELQYGEDPILRGGRAYVQNDLGWASRASGLARRIRLRRPRRDGECQPLGLNGAVSEKDRDKIPRTHKSGGRSPRTWRSARGRGHCVDPSNGFGERCFVRIDEDLQSGSANHVNRWSDAKPRPSRTLSINAPDDKTCLIESLLEVAERPPSGSRARRRVVLRR
jgi:hypothetical protein